MSVFSDDDLKLLKESRQVRLQDGSYMDVHFLLARLEASEQCHGENHRPMLDPEKFGNCICPAHQAWRKAAVK